MTWLTNLFNWFANAPHYMTLTHCMGHDMFWIRATVALDLTVALGYVLIAIHWWKNQRMLPASPAKSALGDMRNIFIFCGLCGYIFIPIKMVWPAWRLYDMFMAVLVFFTWKYALNAKNLKVVYQQLGRSKQLEEDLEKTREESKRKSAFLNALSHDLRTPLNGLMLNAKFAELNLDNRNPEVLANALKEIRNCTQSTASMLDSLLEYAKVDWVDDSNATQEVDVCAALSDLVGRFARDAAEKGIYLRGCEPPHAPIRIQTDRVKFDRIVSNLLSNALKFTRSGGVRVEVEAVRDGVEIHVIDTGIGIAPDVRERLFDEFFQVHNHERDPRKGVGLGLSIARRLAQQLGGDIYVDDAPAGGGSQFTIVLPASARTAASGNGRVAESAARANANDGRPLATV